MHRGIDIAAPVGTNVSAARAGAVSYAGNLGSSGLTVAVRTDDGTYATSYLHLSAIAVSRGQQVDAGQRLGAVGTTGERSAHQPHLHFGVRLADRDDFYVDPLTLLPALPSPAAPATPAPVSAPAPVRAASSPCRSRRPACAGEARRAAGALRCARASVADPAGATAADRRRAGRSGARPPSGSPATDRRSPTGAQPARPPLSTLKSRRCRRRPHPPVAGATLGHRRAWSAGLGLLVLAAAGPGWRWYCKCIPSRYA